MPFDLYCPSRTELIQRRLCNQCGKYFPSQAAIKGRKIIHQNSVMVEQDNDNEEPEGQSMQSNETDQPSAIVDTISDVVTTCSTGFGPNFQLSDSAVSNTSI